MSRDMGIGSGHTRVGELAFSIYPCALHPEWFATRVHQRISRPRWQADLRIVEGGHVIIWSAGPCRLTEILCPADAELPEQVLLFRSTVRHERATALRPAAKVEYQACFSAEHLEPHIFEHLCDELVLDARGSGLFYRFPSSNRLAAQPLSFLRVESNGRSLSVHAAHTYPEERAIVRTQSLIDLLGEWSNGC